MSSVNQLGKDELWRAEVTIKTETKNAVLVEYEGEEEWIAKSQIHDDSEAWKKGDIGDIVIPLWLAKKINWAENN
jgi:hypothetical protein